MTGEPKKKKSFLRRNLDLMLVLLIFTPLYYLYILTQPISPFEPREASFAPYERHFDFSFHFPFVVSYFLMVPENYQPQKHTYPVVLMLHGASRHMYGGKVLARPLMRSHFPFIVVIPIAPFGYVWASPKSFTLRPQALPLAMDALRSVQRKYSVNDKQIYVTGYSMGGMGTYGAISRYPGVFAAAVSTDGIWDPALVSRFDDIPLWIFHGEQDRQIPASIDRLMADILKQQGRDVMYTEYPRQGHGVWIPTYENPDFWLWLIRQKKH